MRLLALAGPAVAAVALVCAITAASFLSAPLVAVLMGVVLAAIPAMGAVLLSQIFPFARYRGVLIGMIVPWLLLAGYLAASFSGLCRGEPEGQDGKRQRRDEGQKQRHDKQHVALNFGRKARRGWVGRGQRRRDVAGVRGEPDEHGDRADQRHDKHAGEFPQQDVFAACGQR